MADTIVNKNDLTLETENFCVNHKSYMSHKS